MAAPTVRNFASFPTGNGDANFGPGGLPVVIPEIGFTFTAVTGDTIVLFIGVGVTVTAVVDNVAGSPNTYVDQGNGWWVAKNIVGGAVFQVTITLNALTQYPTIYLWDVADASRTAPFEQSVSASAGANTTPTVALTTTTADDLILAGVGITATSSAGAMVAAGGSFTRDTNYTQQSGQYVFTPSANNGTTPYGGAEHLGVSGSFSGNVTMPVTSGGASFSAWSITAAAIRAFVPKGAGQVFLM